MKKFTTIISASLLTLSLASCNKESYSFRAGSPYHSNTTASLSQPVAPSQEASAEASANDVDGMVLTASTQKTTVIAPVIAHKAARTYSAQVQATKATPATIVAPTVAEVKAARTTIKAMHKAAKKGTAAVQDTGKSQLVAALLCFFLGGLGVHDFYLGYIGKGILQIFLSLILIGFILVIIDLVRILTGSLKPKGGEYTDKI